eukprot:4804768-Pyramimonas_sp.AAC.1
MVGIVSAVGHGAGTIGIVSINISSNCYTFSSSPLKPRAWPASCRDGAPTVPGAHFPSSLLA